MATATALDNAVHASEAFPNTMPPLAAPSDGMLLKNTSAVLPGLTPESHENEARLWDLTQNSTHEHDGRLWENSSSFAAPLPNQLPNSMQQSQQQQLQQLQQAMKTDHTSPFAMASSPQHQQVPQPQLPQQNGSLHPQLQTAMLTMGAIPVQNFPAQMLMQQQQQLAAANQTRFGRPRLPSSQLPPPVLSPGQPAFIGANATMQCSPHAVLFPPSSGSMASFGGPPPPREFDQGHPMKLSPQANPMQSSPHGNMPCPAMPQQQYSGAYQQVIAPPGGITSQIRMSPCRSPVLGQSALFPSSVVGSQPHQPSLRMQIQQPRHSLPQLLPPGVDIFSQMSPQHAVQRSVSGRTGVPIVGSVSQPQLMHHHDDGVERERRISANMSALRLQVRSDFKTLIFDTTRNLYHLLPEPPQKRHIMFICSCHNAKMPAPVVNCDLKINHVLGKIYRCMTLNRADANLPPPLTKICFEIIHN